MLTVKYQRGGDASRSIAKLSASQDPNARKLLIESADVVAKSIASRVRSGTYGDGLLKQRIMRRTGTKKENNEWTVGVAPYNVVGDPNTKAPSRTIAEFLEGRGKQWKGVFQNPDGSLSTGFRRFPLRLAWWYLPEQARHELNEARLVGMYGGKQGGKIVPAYWYLQEKGTYPAKRPKAQRFVEDGIRDAEAILAGKVDVLAVK